MRFLVKAKIPVEAGNEAARDGRLGEIIGSIIQDTQPEKVYCLEEDGARTIYSFIEMDDASEIPKIAEPWFLAFNARVEFHPVMVPEDLMKAEPAINNAVKKYS